MLLNYVKSLWSVFLPLVLLRIRPTPSELMFGRSTNLGFKPTPLPDIINVFKGKIMKRFAYFTQFI